MLFVTALIAAIPLWPPAVGSSMAHQDTAQVVALPVPRSPQEVLADISSGEGDSVRSRAGGALTLDELSELLWAAGGPTGDSTGARHPMEVYVVAGRVSGLRAGLYRYGGGEHELIRIRAGDLRSELAEAALGRPDLRDADAVIALGAADVDRSSADVQMTVGVVLGRVNARPPPWVSASLR